MAVASTTDPKEMDLKTLETMSPEDLRLLSNSTSQNVQKLLKKFYATHHGLIDPKSVAALKARAAIDTKKVNANNAQDNGRDTNSVDNHTTTASTPTFETIHSFAEAFSSPRKMAHAFSQAWSWVKQQPLIKNVRNFIAQHPLLERGYQFIKSEVHAVVEFIRHPLKSMAAGYDSAQKWASHKLLEVESWGNARLHDASQMINTFNPWGVPVPARIPPTHVRSAVAIQPQQPAPGQRLAPPALPTPPAARHANHRAVLQSQVTAPQIATTAQVIPINRQHVPTSGYKGNHRALNNGIIAPAPDSALEQKVTASAASAAAMQKRRAYAALAAP